MSTIRSIYADGGVIDRNPSSIGGTWAYCHVDDDDNRISEQGGIFIPSPRGLVTNNRMEFLALLSALEALPSGWSGRVCSDSRVTLGRLFHSWKMTGISEDWYRRGSVVLRRLGRLEPILHDGHPTRAQLLAGAGKRGNPVSAHQAWCDAECGRQARRGRLVAA